MERAEIAVVGAGVMGSAAARALAARGVPTLLLEQFELGHTRGSSHGANRIFRFSYPDPVYVRMAIVAREAWLRLQDEASEELLTTTGGLDAGSRAGLCAAALSECGVPHSWLTEGDVRERFPGIAPRPGERMMLQENAGVLLARRAVAALQRLAGRDGASVRPMTPVLSVEPRGDGVLLRTPDGEIRAQVAIVTAGGWAGGLLGPALTRMPPLTVTVQQVQYYAAADPGARWPTFIDWSGDGIGWYVVPVAGGAPGIKVAAHSPGPPVDPRTGPFTVDPELEDAAGRYTRERLPGLLPTAGHAETCLYTMTADQDFLIDREGPIVVGGGGSGHAFKFGPLIGEILADLALGKESSIPRDRFALSRPVQG